MDKITVLCIGTFIGLAVGNFAWAYVTGGSYHAAFEHSYFQYVALLTVYLVNRWGI